MRIIICVCFIVAILYCISEIESKKSNRNKRNNNTVKINNKSERKKIKAEKKSAANDKINSKSKKNKDKKNKNKNSKINKVIKEVKKKVKKILNQSPKNKDEVMRRLRKVKNAQDFFEEFQIAKHLKFQKVERKESISSDEAISVIKPADTYQFSSLVADSAELSPDKQSSEIQSSATMSFPSEFECQPRSKVIEIPLVKDGAFYPACLAVKQCSGCCFNSPEFDCAPTSIKNISTPVFKINYDTMIPEFTNIFMLHHQQCGCRCRIQKEDCSDYQTYDPKNCQCNCGTIQDCPTGKQWSNTSCRCECSRKRTCSNRFVWNGDSCRCKCKKTTCSDSNQVRDPTSCYCVTKS